MATAPTNLPPQALPAAAPPQQPAPVPAAAPAPAHSVSPEALTQPTTLYLYSHSNFFYWWPVWVLGYAFALLTWFNGNRVAIGGVEVLMHPGKSLGVIYSLTIFLVILITNLRLRGMASVVTILTVAFVTLLLAYTDMWGPLVAWLEGVAIFMNMGFYVFFSTLIFGVWVFSVFIYDRMSYYKVTPGQLIHETVIGGGDRSWDARGMVCEKEQADLFRHYVLGLGSGDLIITTSGAKSETLHIPNVLFVGHKIQQIQRLIAMQPDEKPG